MRILIFNLVASFQPIWITDSDWLWVKIAPNCAFYPYDHGFASAELICKQPLGTIVGIVIEDDPSFGVGVIMLGGVRVGKGAAMRADSVATHDIADGAIAVGVPARILKNRKDITKTADEITCLI